MPLTLSSATEQPARRPRLRSLIAAGVTAVLAIAGIVAVSAPASADPMAGTIHGTIDIGGGDIHFSDFNITAFVLENNGGTYSMYEAGATNVLAGGAWAFPTGALPVGDYAFGVHSDIAGPDYFDLFSGGNYSREELLADHASAFTHVGDGEDLTVPTFTMSLGATVHGTVTGNANAALTGEKVQLWRQGTDEQSGDVYWGDAFASQDTAAGAYSFTGLPPGHYTLKFGGTTAYTAEWYDDESYWASPADATSFILVAAQDMTADAQLATGQTIKGTVTNASKKAVPGATITVYMRDQNFEWQVYKTGTTNSKGAFAIPGISGGSAYTIEYSAPGYLTQYWKAKPNLDGANSLTLLTSAYNAVLVRSGSIAGTITRVGGGFFGDDELKITACKLLGGALMDCGDWTGETYGSVEYTAATGAYKITGLTAGTYTVQVRNLGPGNWRDEFFTDKRTADTALRFAIATGGAATGKNIQLDAGAEITGSVGSSAGPVPFASVRVYSSDDFFWDTDSYLKATTAAPDGSYAISGLEKGDYLVVAMAPASAGLADQWYSAAYDPDRATKVHIDSYAAFPGISFNLPESSTIHGTITDRSGDPIENAYVVLSRVVVPGGFNTTDWADVSTDAHGDYTFDDLPPGTYVVSAEGGGDDDAFQQRYFDASTGSSVAFATQITLIPGSNETASFALDEGGTYTGILTYINTLGSQPLRGYDISSEDGRSTTSGTDGSFTLTGLSEGPHTLTVEQPYGSGGVLEVSTIKAGPVSLNSTVDLGTLVLSNPSQIGGTIYGRDGKHVGLGVDVYAIGIDENADPYLLGYTFTNKLGQYNISSLPQVPIYLYIAANGIYDGQFAGGGAYWAQSEPVPVTQGDRVYTRDIKLLSGGIITGTVTNRVTRKAIAGIEVAIGQITPDGEFAEYGTVVTNSKGVYTMAGLEAGSYSVSINPEPRGAGAPYSSQYSTTFVNERSTLKVNAALTAGQKVSGVVTGPGGAKLEGIAVTASLVSGSTLIEGPTDYTDANGAYSMYLQAGTWTLFFTDGQGRVASSYLGGTTGWTASTKVVVAKAALPNRSIALSPTTGSIDFDISGSAEPDPTGMITLEQLDGNAGPVIATTYFGGCGCDSLSELMPITNLREGDYRLTIEGYSAAGQFGGEYAPEVITFHLNDGEQHTLGPVVLSGLHLYTSYDFPHVIPGFEPAILSSGSPKVGDTLLVDNGGWDGPVSTYYYQWLRDGKPIPGATTSSYVLKLGDAGAHISLRIGTSNVDLPASNFSYLAKLTPAIARHDAPTESGQAAVAGAARVGSILTAKPGNWDCVGLTFTYQWQRYDTVAGTTTPIAGATNATYVPTAADLDMLLSVQITSHHTGFEDGTAYGYLNDPITPKLAVKVVAAPKVTALPGGGWRVTPGTYSPATVPGLIWKVWNYDGTLKAQYPGSSWDFTDAGVIADDTRVTVEVQAAKTGYTTATVVLNARLGTADWDVAPTSPGFAAVGSVVGLDDGSAVTLPNTGVVRTYQWYRGTAKITGATKATYTPVALDLGKQLSVKVTLSAPGHTSTTSEFLITAAVAPAPPIVAGSVTITGRTGGGVPALGRTVTVTPTGWAPTPTAYTYVWKRDGVVIPKATKASYLITAADKLKAITVTVTGTRAGHTAAALIDVPIGTADVEPLQSIVAPSLPATAQVGVKLTVNPGKYDLAPTSYAYVWYRNDTIIEGATGPSYTPIPSDVGEEISVSVEARRTGFLSSAPLTAYPAVVDKGAAAKPLSVPIITVNKVKVTSVKQGTILTATPGTWPIVALQFRYQWQVSTDGVTWIDVPDDPTYGDMSDGSAFWFTSTVGNRYRVVVTPLQRAGYVDSVPVTSGSVLIKP